MLALWRLPSGSHASGGHERNPPTLEAASLLVRFDHEPTEVQKGIIIQVLAAVYRAAPIHADGWPTVFGAHGPAVDINPPLKPA
jgi:hypothetical protein